MLRYIAFTAIFTLTVFSIVLYTSCTKTDTNKCANITCQNGGTCSGGVCYCTTGYTGTYCDKKLCEVNNTARVRFTNKTGTSLTYSVVWDGSTLTTIGPGATTDYYTVSAGPHTLHFMIANSTNEACTISTPVLTQCFDHEYWCTK